MIIVFNIRRDATTPNINLKEKDFKIRLLHLREDIATLVLAVVVSEFLH